MPLLFSKFRGGNSKFGINWQNLAKIRFSAIGRRNKASTNNIIETIFEANITRYKGKLVALHGYNGTILKRVGK